MSKYKTDGSVIIDVEADLSKFQASISKIATVGTVAFTALVGSAAMATKAIIDVGVGFESAFAGVKKTVNASEKELEGFRKEILNLSTEIPIVANEIAGIAEAAGQLGIKNENLMTFTRTMADLGVATNMASTEAATSFARFANITNMNQKEFDRLGSTVVELGNKLATTEREIADLALNMASVGSQVGMTEAEIMGLAAALSSVGIEAAAGGTSMRTILSDMQLAVETGNKDLEKFANVANKSSEEFVKAFKEDATGAFLAFVEGLGDTERLGSSATKILDEMGISEARLTNLLKSGSNAVDLFKNSIAIANTAWEENTALTKEAAQRYETTESKMQILNNTIAKAGITAFEKFKEPFKDAIDTGIESVQQLTGELENGKLGKSVDNVANSFNNMLKKTIEVGTKALPPLIDGLSWILDNGNTIVATVLAYNIAMKGMLVIRKVQGAIDMFKVSMHLASRTTTLAGNALAMYTLKGNIAAKASTLLAGGMSTVAMIAAALAIAGIAALTVGLINYEKKVNASIYALREKNKAIKESIKSMGEMKEASQEQMDATIEEISVLESYYQVLKKNTDENGVYTGSQEKLAVILKELNGAFPELNASYDANTGKIIDQNGVVLNLNDSIGELIKSKKIEAYLDAYKDDYATSIKTQSDAVKENVAAHKELKDIQEKINSVDLAALTNSQSIEEYNKILSEAGVSSALELEQMYKTQNELSTTIASNNELITNTKGVISDYDKVMESFTSGDIDEALSKMSGFENLTLYDPSKGQEQVDGLKTQVTDIEDTIKGLESLKVDNPEIASVYQEQIDLLSANLATANGELKEAQLVHDAEMAELSKTAGETSATAHTDAYKLKADAGMAETGTSSASAFESASKTHLAGIAYAPKYVDIIARYVGFTEGSGGVSSGAFPGASYDDNQDPYPIIQPNYSRRMIDSAKSVINQVQSRIRNASSVGNMTLQLQGGNGGGTTDIQQHVNFNQPIRKTSDVTRALEKAARDLKKVR